mgnify:CR=1 FL=1
MSLLKSVIASVFILVTSFSTALAGWTTPPKLALIPDNYKNPTEGYDILDSYGKQVEACTDMECCDKITQKIAEQFLPDNVEKFTNHVHNIFVNTDEANTLVLGFSRYFGDKGLNSLVEINRMNLEDYKNYLYKILSFYADKISDCISLEDATYPESPK